MIPIIRPVMDEREASAARRVILSGWITQGPEVAAFENEFAAFVGAPHACAVSNCTTALHLALLAVGVGADEIAPRVHVGIGPRLEVVVPARRQVRLVVAQVGAGMSVGRDDHVAVGHGVLPGARHGVRRGAVARPPPRSRPA